MSIREYSWWGFDENSPPEHLKTKKQLSAIGLKPGEPVGVIRTPDYNCYLYDPSTCLPKRPLTEKQKAAIARRKHLKEQAELERKKQLAWYDLKAYLDRIPAYLKSLQCDHDWEWLGFRSHEEYIKNRCDRIITICRHAKEELNFLYPKPLPPVDTDGQCRLAVLGGSQVPLDPDGQCRAAVLGGYQSNTRPTVTESTKLG